MEAESSENSVNPVAYDIQQLLENAEREAAALQKNLMEEPMEKLLQEQRLWISEKEAEVKEVGDTVG